MDVRAYAGHSGMDMPHGSSGHHMDMGTEQCSMNMVFTWSTKNLCIIFRSWRITSTTSLIWSLLAIAALTAGYEVVRELARKYEAATQPWSRTGEDDGRNGRASPAQQTSRARERGRKSVKAALYAVQVFYSFFIMLLFMTYNGWVMLAVTVGAFVGYLAFGGSAGSVKSVACH